ncbi:MAG: hypothetical protein WA399_16890 [Acidobacteriaceae bacterium]
MSAADLINRLMEIERVAGKARALEVHSLVLEAQGSVLEIQRQMIDTLRENVRLRERLEKYEPTSPARVREPRLPSHAEIARELMRMPKPVADDAGVPFHLAAS